MMAKGADELNEKAVVPTSEGLNDDLAIGSVFVGGTVRLEMVAMSDAVLTRDFGDA